MTKIKNNNLIKKKGIENGNINFEIGLKPHSNGIFFSKFNFFIIDKYLFKLKIIIEIKIIKQKKNK